MLRDANLTMVIHYATTPPAYPITSSDTPPLSLLPSHRRADVQCFFVYDMCLQGSRLRPASFETKEFKAVAALMLNSNADVTQRDKRDIVPGLVAPTLRLLLFLTQSPPYAPPKPLK